MSLFDRGFAYSQGAYEFPGVQGARVALVENIDLGVMEAQPLRPPVKSTGARAAPAL